MNILILGSGGREHALAWAVAQNPKCDRLISAPGNPGMAALGDCVAIDPCDPDAVVALCDEYSIDFVVIGAEAPLAAGVADALRAAGVLCFGPSKAAAKLEASKAFTKEICDASGAPTAGYAHFTNESAALDYVRAQGMPLVIKADGLAAGKGVIIPETLGEAETAISEMFGGQFGAAGAEVVIEEFMTGEEASLFVLCHGETAMPVGTAQDHKRVGEGDTGLNTGGMGAYSPAPVLTDAVLTQAMDEIIHPTLAEMARRGTPFEGVLYAGLMIEDGRARLVEYNVRFGDPECQALCARLGAQMLDLLLAAARGEEIPAPQWADDHAMTVVMAAKGYPEAYQKGTEITGAESNDPLVQIFHAGTAMADGKLTASGGRVLNITARGPDLAAARDRAYGAIDGIDWEDGFYRRDIGWRAL
ncbi:phosphoribosylamine--glycine ligase [Paracoccaceae bacterium GXU_MW_L88]